MKKVHLYVDGFNLYYGLCHFGGRFKWLDLVALGKELCLPGERLERVVYCTARVSGSDKSKIRRQNVYLEALQETGVEIVLGKFKQRKQKCPHCKKTYDKPEEKESDVNLAAHLLRDAASGQAQTTIVVSADSDLILPMQMARDEYGCRVVPVFPPNRHSAEVQQRIGTPFRLGRTILRKCQLPQSITKGDGYVLYRPKKWR